MKQIIKYTALIMLILSITKAEAQTLNWANAKSTGHILNANLGAEHGTVYGLGYGYRVKNKLFPFMLNVEFSTPGGDKVLDDFKSKIGGHVRWVSVNNFQFSTKLQGVYRRYENDLVKMNNFGSDMSATLGYYRRKLFVAGEFGFDKSIVTRFQHTKAYKDQYPGVVDGWYEPSTGGNFYYGLQAGFSFGLHDIYVKAGKMISQDLRSTPMLPLYGQIGYNIRF